MNLNRKQVNEFLNKTGSFIVTHRVSVFLVVLVVIAIIVGVWREHSDRMEVINNGTNDTSISDSVSNTESDSTVKAEEVKKDSFSIGWSNAIIFIALAIGLVVIKKKKDLGTTDSDRKAKDEDEIEEE
jgi:preprotein translocase subunit SecG